MPASSSDIGTLPGGMSLLVLLLALARLISYVDMLLLSVTCLLIIVHAQMSLNLPRLLNLAVVILVCLRVSISRIIHCS